MEVTVLTVDDSAVFRAAAAELVAAADGFLLAGEAADAAEALRLVQELRPDLVLLDDRLGEDDGLVTAGRIAALGLGTVVALVTADEVEALRERAVGAGVAAVLDKRSLRPGALREVWDAR